MVEKIIAERKDVSYSVYTQTTDLENECDGVHCRLIFP